MKWNVPLSFLALGHIAGNLLILVYFRYFYNVPEQQLTSLGQALFAFFVFAVFWAAFMILTLVFSVVHYKSWFKKEKRISTIILLFLCTPLPVFLHYFVSAYIIL